MRNSKCVCLAVKLQGLAILLKTTISSETCSCFKLTISNAIKSTIQKNKNCSTPIFVSLWIIKCNSISIAFVGFKNEKSHPTHRSIHFCPISSSVDGWTTMAWGSPRSKKLLSRKLQSSQMMFLEARAQHWPGAIPAHCYHTTST